MSLIADGRVMRLQLDYSITLRVRHAARGVFRRGVVLESLTVTDRKTDKHLHYSSSQSLVRRRSSTEFYFWQIL